MQQVPISTDRHAAKISPQKGPDGHQTIEKTHDGSAETVHGEAPSFVQDRQLKKTADKRTDICAAQSKEHRKTLNR